VALSAFDPRHWFIVFKSGLTRWHVPESWVPKIREVIMTYTNDMNGYADTNSSALTSQRLSYNLNIREMFGRQMQLTNMWTGPSRQQEWVRTGAAVVAAIGTFVGTAVGGSLGCAVK